jgi:general secretion pathway protein G
MIFLRRVPRDPFAPDAAIPDAATWNLRSYGAPPGDYSSGADVFDVASSSNRRSLDGSPYSGW